MEAYLNRYCNYISKIKNGVNIPETLQFISNDEFDAAEIINAYKDIINIENICKLLNNKNFLPNSNYNEKYDIFLHFFSNLHNYAKNLIKHFDIYSSKTIQASSVVMKDNLMLFPHYRRYMETLLGYEYDAFKSEWAMNRHCDNEMRRQLAVVCIVSAIGHQQIDDMDVEGSHSSSDSDGHSSSSDRDGHSSSRDRDGHSSSRDRDSHRHMSPPLKENTPCDRWYCQACSSVNEITNVNCVVCLTEQPMKIKIEQTKILSREHSIKDEKIIKRIDPSIVDCRRRHCVNKWVCGHCTLENVDTEDVCRVCLINRFPEEVYMIKDEGKCDKLESRRLKDKNNSINGTVDGVGRMRIENERIPSRVAKQRTWKCNRCSLINDLSKEICDACLGTRMEDGHNNNNTKRADENHWQCHSCTFINDEESKECLVCAIQRRERRGVCDKCHSFYNMNAKCLVCHDKDKKIDRSPVYVNETHRPPSLVKTGWSCVHCTHHNEPSIANCTECYSPRDSPMKGSRERIMAVTKPLVNTKPRRPVLVTDGIGRQSSRDRTDGTNKHNNNAANKAPNKKKKKKKTKKESFLRKLGCLKPERD